MSLHSTAHSRQKHFPGTSLGQDIALGLNDNRARLSLCAIRIGRKYSETAFCVLLAVLAYSASLYLFDLYKTGDQIHYRQFYDSIIGAEIDEVSASQVGTLGGAEPIFGIIMWAGANLGIPKDNYVSVYNALLIVCLYLVLRFYRVHFTLIALMLTNFYVLVLLTSAERLKFAYLFLLLALLISRKSKWGLGLIPVALLVHFQMAIICFGVCVYRIVTPLASRELASNSRVNKRKWWHGKGPLLIAPGVVCGAMLLIGFSDAISSKLLSYLKADADFSEATNLSVMLLVGLCATRNRMALALSVGSIAVMAAYLGGTRLNMVGFSVLLYCFLSERRFNHPFIGVMLLYFTVKAGSFMANIYTYGNGFDGF